MVKENYATSIMRTNSQGKNVHKCFPVFWIMSALKMFNVDYFSLDIEGPELQVLQSVPWDKVNVTVNFCFGFCCCC